MPTKQHSPQLKIVARGNSEDYAWIEVAIMGTLLTVDARLAQLLVERFPTLPNHACKSSGSAGAHQTFGDHLVGALLPHAAEHVAIELLVARYPGESFAGNSSWISREKQTMRVRVSLPRKESADSTRALSEAIQLLNQLIALSQRQKA